MTASTVTKPTTPARLLDVRELFCGACGYGIVVRREPPDCPMCRASEWREQPGYARWN
jgi:hypothetical protein